MREIKFRAFHKKEKKMYYSDEASSLHYFIEFTTKEPFYGELLQYTGLKDKNGKEIYEGDIVNFGDNRDFKVVWVIKYGAWYVKPCGYYENNAPLGKSEKACEVIGNIYENPELLKEKGEK